MSIKELLGFESDKKIRYAVAGAGDIAQEDMMPGIAHTGNSTFTAVVTGDPIKAEALKKMYDLEATYSYEQFGEAIKAGTFDAIYLATPNWRHAEFAVPALQAGIHVLVEKPLEISTAKCQEILDVAKTSSAKLMVAYRLHFEPATLDTVKRIREGELGNVHLFTSSFSQMVDPENHRAKAGDLAGPVFDMGPYPVNAARYVFGDEPTEVVSAVGSKHPESGLEQDFFDTVTAIVRFPGNRLAQFCVSYYADATNEFNAMGTKGRITLNPCYMFGKSLKQTISKKGEEEESSFKNTDHFGGELKYFSDCILNNTDVEPDGEEGFADVRVLEGILEALKTGSSVTLAPFARTKRIDPDAQVMKLGAVSTPDLVHTSNPGKDVEKQPKN